MDIEKFLEDQERELRQVFERQIAELNLIQGRLLQIQIMRDALRKSAQAPQIAEEKAEEKETNHG